MKSLVLISAVFLQVGWSYAAEGSNGVGAFSYQDSAGTRYGGTYGLKDGEVVDAKGDFPPDFTPPDFTPPDFNTGDFTSPNYEEGAGFIPEYFKNLENLLEDPFQQYNPLTPQTPFNWHPFARPIFNPFPFGLFKPFNFNTFMNRAFQANLENQRLALNAAHKAFDLTLNQPGFVPLNPFRFNLFSESGFPMPSPPQFPKGFPFSGPMPGFGSSSGVSSFAGAAAGPGINRHVAGVSPSNPLSPNINLMNVGSGMPGGFKEVAITSFASTSNVNGRTESKQGAETYINDNGKITSYSVHNP